MTDFSPVLSIGGGHCTRLALKDEALRKITQPAVTVHGRNDQVIPFAVSEGLVQHLPTAVLHPIDQCWYWVEIEEAREFFDSVEPFLAQNRRLNSCQVTLGNWFQSVV